MLLEWELCFDLAGFTADELTEATRWIATNAPPKWRSDHLPALRDRIRQRRGELHRLAMESRPGHDWQPCHWCQDTGWAVVPHPKDLRGPEWVFPFTTFTVTCKCNRGLRVETSNSERKRGRPMRLADYELKNDFWVQQKSRRERLVVAEAAAKESGREADGRHKDDDAEYRRIIGSLCRKFALRGPGEEG